jgi:hypothetical protein
LFLGCKTWPVILGDEKELMVFENWLLRRNFRSMTNNRRMEKIA